MVEVTTSGDNTPAPFENNMEEIILNQFSNPSKICLIFNSGIERFKKFTRSALPDDRGWYHVKRKH